MAKLVEASLTFPLSFWVDSERQTEVLADAYRAAARAGGKPGEGEEGVMVVEMEERMSLLTPGASQLLVHFDSPVAADDWLHWKTAEEEIATSSHVTLGAKRAAINRHVLPVRLLEEQGPLYTVWPPDRGGELRREAAKGRVLERMGLKGEGFLPMPRGMFLVGLGMPLTESTLTTFRSEGWHVVDMGGRWDGDILAAERRGRVRWEIQRHGTKLKSLQVHEVPVSMPKATLKKFLGFAWLGVEVLVVEMGRWNRAQRRCTYKIWVKDLPPTAHGASGRQPTGPQWCWRGKLGATERRCPLPQTPQPP